MSRRFCQKTNLKSPETREGPATMTGATPGTYPAPRLPLTGLRVLDLTDHRGLLAGHLLAQLGADVVQVESAGGSTARRVAPLGPDGQSLVWEAYGAGKRGSRWLWTRHPEKPASSISPA